LFEYLRDDGPQRTHVRCRQHARAMASDPDVENDGSWSGWLGPGPYGVLGRGCEALTAQISVLTT
jgi:hypothetical protein